MGRYLAQPCQVQLSSSSWRYCTEVRKDGNLEWTPNLWHSVFVTDQLLAQDIQLCNQQLGVLVRVVLGQVVILLAFYYTHPQLLDVICLYLYIEYAFIKYLQWTPSCPPATRKPTIREMNQSYQIITIFFRMHTRSMLTWFIPWGFSPLTWSLLWGICPPQLSSSHRLFWRFRTVFASGTYSYRKSECLHLKLSTFLLWFDRIKPTLRTRDPCFIKLFSQWVMICD